MPKHPEKPVDLAEHLLTGKMITVNGVDIGVFTTSLAIVLGARIRKLGDDGYVLNLDGVSLRVSRPKEMPWVSHFWLPLGFRTYKTHPLPLATARVIVEFAQAWDHPMKEKA